MAKKPLIILDKVTKSYRSNNNKIDVLTDISFCVREGEFLAVVGPSGCGKTTLLKLIAGLLVPTGGSISVGDKTVTGPLGIVGMVFQSPVLLPWRRVLQNVLLPIEILGGNKNYCKQQALELLSLVGIEEFAQRWPWELSLGMQQRVALCRALIHDPPLLLLDEPFAAVDALTREELDVELERLWAAKQKTIILVTHSIEEAVLLADHIIVLTPRPGQINARIQVSLPRPRAVTAKKMSKYWQLCSVVRENLAKV
ncbi:MAG: ABC transporter ATP-binding protein [Candidatus Methanomethyliaceae archaeon]